MQSPSPHHYRQSQPLSAMPFPSAAADNSDRSSLTQMPANPLSGRLVMRPPAAANPPQPPSSLTSTPGFLFRQNNAYVNNVILPSPPNLVQNTNIRPVPSPSPPVPNSTSGSLYQQQQQAASSFQEAAQVTAAMPDVAATRSSGSKTWIPNECPDGIYVAFFEHGNCGRFKLIDALVSARLRTVSPKFEHCQFVFDWRDGQATIRATFSTTKESPSSFTTTRYKDMRWNARSLEPINGPNMAAARKQLFQWTRNAEHSPFNTIGHYWNFVPPTSCCTCCAYDSRGSAYFCAEQVATALKEIGFPAFETVRPYLCTPDDVYKLLSEGGCTQIIIRNPYSSGNPAGARQRPANVAAKKRRDAADTMITSTFRTDEESGADDAMPQQSVRSGISRGLMSTSSQGAGGGFGLTSARSPGSRSAADVLMPTIGRKSIRHKLGDSKDDDDDRPEDHAAESDSNNQPGACSRCIISTCGLCCGCTCCGHYPESQRAWDERQTMLQDIRVVGSMEQLPPPQQQMSVSPPQ